MAALLFVSKGWQGTTAVLSPAGRPRILNFSFLKRGCVLNIQAVLTISIVFSLKLPVEENPRPPPGGESKTTSRRRIQNHLQLRQLGKVGLKSGQERFRLGSCRRS